MCPTFSYKGIVSKEMGLVKCEKPFSLDFHLQAQIECQVSGEVELKINTKSCVHYQAIQFSKLDCEVAF